MNKIIFLVIVVSMCLFCTTGCYYRKESNPYVIKITDYGDRVGVGIAPPASAPSNTDTVGLPPKSWDYQTSSFLENIDGKEFQGLIIEGGADSISVLAARLPNSNNFKVIIDSTLPLIVRGKMIEPDGTIGKTEVNVAPGKRELLLDCSHAERPMEKTNGS